MATSKKASLEARFPCPELFSLKTADGDGTVGCALFALCAWI